MAKAQKTWPWIDKASPDSPADLSEPTGSGFAIPDDYAYLKRTFETRDEFGYSDLFYQTFDRTHRSRVWRDGQEFINFCSYDYLGLASSPEVTAAAVDAIGVYGTSVSASRLVSGERPIHQQLERSLANFLGSDDAIVFVSGYSTNADTIGHLMGPDDLIVYDSLIHASVRQGIKLSGATARPFKHADLGSLEKILQRGRDSFRQVLIIVEGVYSMDGDIPDLPRLVALKRKFNALLMVDEAHSLGVLGRTGRGIGEHHGVASTDVDLWMGTLSKSLASCGGYIAGTQALVTYLRHSAPGYVYSVGMPPPMAAAALASLQVLAREPERVQRLRDRVGLFHDLATQYELNTGEGDRDAAIVPVMVPDPRVAAALARYLLTQHILALPIGFPAVPRNRTRLRFFLSCSHSEDDIRRTIEVMSEGIVVARDLVNAGGRAA
jgi:8-amino-7-oxononanoate synthase